MKFLAKGELKTCAFCLPSADPVSPLKMGEFLTEHRHHETELLRVHVYDGCPNLLRKPHKGHSHRGPALQSAAFSSRTIREIHDR